MKASDVANCLKRFKKKYRFRTSEKELLGKIKDCEVHSISYTVDGGFDLDTGEFHPEERDTCYKVRIRYKSFPSGEVKMLCLIGVKNYQKNISY